MTDDTAMGSDHQTNHPELLYCPRCGEEVEPLMGTSNTKRARMWLECPKHGEIEVEYSER